MNIRIEGVAKKLIRDHIFITGSKSESNRLLILQQLFPEISIDNLSDADDTHHLQHALKTSDTEIHIGHAGTAMRFLTAFFATQKGRTVFLSGSDRMHHRPIQILVDALKALGANISYTEKKGFPPLKITGKDLTEKSVNINGNVSSQYISALLLVAPHLPNGLHLKLQGRITSMPYIEMTLSLLDQIGVSSSFNGQDIEIHPLRQIPSRSIVVESDWSSASYFYSIVALSEVGSEITLSAYKETSLQGDSVLSHIYRHFGVTTEFLEHKIVLKKVAMISGLDKNSHFTADLNKAPDIAQTIAVTCFGLGISCDLTGLHTLKIKETDRLEALKAELTKLGADIFVTSKSLHLKRRLHMSSGVRVKTYHDHRMAMAFAPLGMLTSIEILDANVVTKSYRNFWIHLKQIGFHLVEV